MRRRRFSEEQIIGILLAWMSTVGDPDAKVYG